MGEVEIKDESELIRQKYEKDQYWLEKGIIKEISESIVSSIYFGESITAFYDIGKLPNFHINNLCLKVDQFDNVLNNSGIRKHQIGTYNKKDKITAYATLDPVMSNDKFNAREFLRTNFSDESLDEQIRFGNSNWFYNMIIEYMNFKTLPESKENTEKELVLYYFKKLKKLIGSNWFRQAPGIALGEFKVDSCYADIKNVRQLLETELVDNKEIGFDTDVTIIGSSKSRYAKIRIATKDE